MEYAELLRRGQQNLPEVVHEKARFELPKIRGHLEGNKTVITNFLQIADSLRRPPEHLLKYILRELATPGDVRRNLLVLGAKVAASRINEKVRQYAEEFVFCKECGKPDTDIKQDGDFSYLVCSVCGARHPVKSKI
ncbi:translation initiation factor IF-2 subunit beta [Candidatus Woesearchaeota archaeon]|nr:translation initiation factor IF-2 subunit beta [Candidatus Woesearchaeota archaeon]